GEVGSIMRPVRNAVKDALAAEAGRLAGRLERHDEAVAEAFALVATGESLGFALGLGGDPGEQGRVLRRHLVLRQTVDTLHVVVDRGDGQLPGVAPLALADAQGSAG